MRIATLRAAFLGTAALALAAAAGCANILGIDDFSVLDAGDSSTGEPGSPESGTESGGSSDATVPPDGRGGEGGEGGQGGEAGDAGNGQDAPDALDGTIGDGDSSPGAGEAGNGDAPGGGDALPGDAGVPDAPTCVGGGTCSPGACQVGQLECDGGSLVCSSVQPILNGTPCGGDGGEAGATGSVCSQGACNPCNSGGDCSTADSCKRSVYVCSTGSAVCTDAGSVSDGTGCGSGMYCYGGVCSACTVGASCTPSTACHTGTVSSCAGGVATCMDTGQPASNGTSCGTNVNMVCNGGVCSSCTANVVCTPAKCHTGLTSCATGTSTCVDTGNQADTTPCTGTDLCNQTYTCQGGMCTGSMPVVCKAADQCHGVGTCDSTTGVCSNPTLTGPTCTGGTDLCDQTYTCQAGVCTGSNPKMCQALDQCHSAGTCDSTSGMCSNPALTGTTCDAGDPCMVNDKCQAGTCSGTPKTCTALDNCHVAGVCGAGSGMCSNPTQANGTSCGVDMECTTGACGCKSGVGTFACSDNSHPCAGWDFETATVEGWTYDTSRTTVSMVGFGVASGVAGTQGTYALSVPFNGGMQTQPVVAIVINLCSSGGTVDLTGKSITGQIFFKGPGFVNGGLDDFFFLAGGVAGSDNLPATGSFMPINNALPAGPASTITLVIGLEPWDGNIYLDDLRIQ